MRNDYPGLSILDVATGEILMTLDEWLQDHRRRQLQLILAQLGRGGGGRFQANADDVDAAAQLLFAPRDGPDMH